MNEKERHLYYLRKSIEVSKQALASGNTPFGAILVDPSGAIVLEQGNVEVTTGSCAGHAETTLMVNASRTFSKQQLWQFTLYTSVEPCAMCAGAIYWGNVGTVVYGMSESRLSELTGDDERNLTLNLPCRDVFACGRKPIEVIGPFPEIDAETAAVHAGYWT
ncbi:nucleoside deaminase [Paenibacillus lignilyticus]|uniref:Nucleoside deaminase n=1 Tax=Paenibacillus lignilyticus TaxID=1172615 RepID=A0ABS5CDZ0_9BACL|nr:nucleoside deaminase [Paenibacillus lignilyticus]